MNLIESNDYQTTRLNNRFNSLNLNDLQAETVICIAYAICYTLDEYENFMNKISIAGTIADNVDDIVKQFNIAHFVGCDDVLTGPQCISEFTEIENKYKHPTAITPTTPTTEDVKMTDLSMTNLTGKIESSEPDVCFESLNAMNIMFCVMSIDPMLEYAQATKIVNSIRYATNHVEFDWTPSLQLDEVSQVIFMVNDKYNKSNADFDASQMLDMCDYEHKNAFKIV